MRMPAIRYQQGGRTMYVTAGSPEALVKFIEAPRLYDPRRPHEPGNRTLDKGHLQGIVRYLEQEQDFVIGATTLYVRPGVVRFRAVDEGDTSDHPVQLGHMALPIGTRFTIGDGQHRLRAYEHVLQVHGADEHDPVLENIRRSGTPVIIVEEADAAKTAQDFVDLQRNVKPLSSSLGASLDRRWGINRLAMDLAKSVALLNDGAPGARIEYLSQTLSKLSPKMYTFASWRFAVGLILTGKAQGGRRSFEQAAEGEIARRGFDECLRQFTELFDYAAVRLPGWTEVVQGDLAVPAFRERFALGSAAGLNAFAGAIHLVERNGWEKTVRRIATVDWLKTAEEGDAPVFFEGTIVQEGKVVSSRVPIEAAIARLREHLANVPVQVA
jgi:DGQHR domain-containing protein